MIFNSFVGRDGDGTGATGTSWTVRLLLPDVGRTGGFRSCGGTVLIDGARSGVDAFVRGIAACVRSTGIVTGRGS